MLDNKIGYIICESSTVNTSKEAVVLDNRNGRVVIETVLQDADNLNRNRRYYAKEELFPALESSRIKELIKNRSFFGEASHPMSQDLSRQQTIDLGRVSHEILELKTEGNLVKGIVKATPTKFGKEFNDFVLDGTKPAFSLRALGSIANTKRGAEVKNINIITWDWVIFPSHQVAYMQQIRSLEEGTNLISHDEKSRSLEGCGAFTQNESGLLVPITNESVMKYIKNESANINTILKSFDTLYESATLVENGSKVRLMTLQGDILMINLESYIQNEIMDYCYR